MRIVAWRTRIAGQVDRSRQGTVRRKASHLRLFSHTSTYRAGRVESLYIDTVPPTTIQKNAAEAFFANHLPIKSWTAEEWRSQPHSDPAFLVPEVAFLGRSNSGKSSLLNALLQQHGLCRVGAKPGKTKTMHAWSLGPKDPTTGGARKGFDGNLEPKLNVMDMPGYGFGSRADWGDSIMKYLVARRQLRRAFVLVNPVHGLKTGDLHMLELLQSKGIPYQVIATKCDHESVKRLPQLLENLQKDIRSALKNNSSTAVLAIIDDVLATGGLGDGKMNDQLDTSAMKGLNDVRWAILRATGLEEYALSVDANKTSQPPHENPYFVPSEVVHPALLQGGTKSVVKAKSKDKDKPKDKAKQKKLMSPPAKKREGVESEQHINDAHFPWHQSTPSDNIGIGMDDLLAMTAPKPNSTKMQDDGRRGSPAIRSGGRVRPHIRK